MVHAVQWKGDNQSELDEFAPGRFVFKEGDDGAWMSPPPPSGTYIKATEWVIDDPYIGQLAVITDAAFQQRFDAHPVA